MSDIGWKCMITADEETYTVAIKFYDKSDHSGGRNFVARIFDIGMWQYIPVSVMKNERGRIRTYNLSISRYNGTVVSHDDEWFLLETLSSHSAMVRAVTCAISAQVAEWVHINAGRVAKAIGAYNPPTFRQHLGQLITNIFECITGPTRVNRHGLFWKLAISLTCRHLKNENSAVARVIVDPFSSHEITSLSAKEVRHESSIRIGRAKGI